MNISMRGALVGALVCLFFAGSLYAACPSGPPTLTAPANASQVAFGNVQLNWNAVPGATFYDVYVGLDGDTPSQVASVFTTQYTDQFEPGRNVQWKVVARADSCTATVSGYFFFSTSCPNVVPILQSPTRSATFAPGDLITFDWTPVPGAAGYDVYVTPDFGQTFQAIAENITDTEFASDDLGEGDWGWYVRTNFNAGCQPLYSEPSNFRISEAGGECPSNPAKATLVSPAPNATNLSSPVTFTWNAVPGARGYRVLAGSGNGEPVPLGGTADTSLTVRLPAGTGYWLVQTFFGESCATTLSERRAFTVTQGTSCNNTPPQLLAPANNAQLLETRTTFKWSDVPGAIAYELHVSTGDNLFNLYGVTSGDTTELERFVPRGTLDWYVVARFSGCPDVRSSTFRFTVAQEAACPVGATVTIVEPASNAQVTSPVTVRWNAVQNATQYRVTLRSSAGSFTSRTASTSVDLRLPAGQFFVVVEALPFSGSCVISSQERSFTVVPGANCASNPVATLIAPVGTVAQPATAQSPVNLRWNAAANALAYRVWISRDGRPFEDLGVTTQANTTVELEEGKYAWFVNALFEGCAPTRSETAYFLIPAAACSRTAPAIVGPAEGTTVSSDVTFSWSAVPGAEKYRVIAIVDGSPVLVGTTTSTQLSRILPPDKYLYTVEAVFESCTSTFAPRTGFTVARAQNCSTEAPQLVSPANATTTTEQETEFVWAPVSGALRYALIVQAGNGTETVLGTTEDTHLMRRLPPGAIEWRVVAFFPGCDERTSQTFRLQVERPAGCTERRPVLLFPKDDDGSVPSPVQFTWIGVPDADEYRVWIVQDDERPSIAATTANTNAEVSLPPGRYRWFVEARHPACPPTLSAFGEFTAGAPIACGTPRKPDAHVIGQALSGTTYRVRWTPLPNVDQYEVQESATADFANAATFVVPTVTKSFSHVVTGAPVQYFYRVRGLSSCSDTPGPYSDVAPIYIVAPKSNNASAELGETGAIVQTIFLPGIDAPRQFSARVDKPWLTVTPASGTVPVEGLTLTVTAITDTLRLGTNTGTVLVDYGSGSAGGVATNADTKTSFPMSVSLVTPVTPTGKGTPPPDALIFGAVGHASGVNDSLFESDIRLTNLTAQTMKYDLNYTPSGVDGTDVGSSSTIEVAPNATLALDDVVASMFGSGTVGSALGMLEIRPVTTSESSGGLFGSIASAVNQQIQTAASSRTYNFTPNGTFGQYIPATPFSQFVGRDTILSLQQVAQSTQFRANFGFLEAAGSPVELLVRVYDVANTLLATIPVSLGATQHRQMNGLLQSNGINDLADGRVEVEVVGGDGKVTAYVSEVDNLTNDPLLVSPVVKGAVRANRYVVPGMAYINTGSAFWVTDLRIFNAGTTATPATLTFYPMGNPGAAMTREISLEPGEIEVLDNVLVNTFGVNATSGGAIVVSTPQETALTATARTYNQTANGTYGQFIPGVTVADSVGLDDRALQILQVEQSTRFRTNIGLNETSGQPVTIEVALITPDQLATPVVTIGLQANEFRQIGLVDFAPPSAVYNGRVTVKVIAGEGKVTAYGSAIDAITQDPTYVPAQ